MIRANLLPDPPTCACSVDCGDLDTAVKRLLSCPKCRAEILENVGTGAMRLRDLAQRYGGDVVCAAVNRARRGE